jgi:hypothetical protein
LVWSCGPAAASFTPPGNKHPENKAMYKIPTIAQGPPTTAMSNKPKGSISGFFFDSNPATTKLVEVPIMEHMPPNMEANDSGMRKVEGRRPIWGAH